MRRKRLELNSSLTELAVTPSDWHTVSPSALLWMFQQMALIRLFEEKLLELKDRGLVNGPVHSSVGQEAVAVGAAAAVRTSDKFLGTHRAHHQYLAKAMQSVGAVADPLAWGLSENIQEHVRVLLMEIMGLSEGCCGGRGGSMHLFNRDIGIAGTNAIVGGGVPIATGVAWADAFQKRDDITLCFFGDGAVYQGTIHEALNLASKWKAPAIYVIENNEYAVATPRQTACSAARLCDIAAAYGMSGFRADGMDVVAVRSAVSHIISTREASLPCVLELATYRHFHHAGNIPGSAYGYRDKREESAWRERDPLRLAEARLRESGVIDDEKLDILLKNAASCVQRAVDACVETQSGGTLAIREKLWPDAQTIASGLRDENIEGIGPFVEQEDQPCPRVIKYSDAIAEVTGRWLERDPLAFVLGEEVANFEGGAYGATKGLARRYPDRIRNTPITEAGFCGLACGAAMEGMHPIVELMFSSFGLVAADQLFNQIAQLAHIYNGKTALPLVVRTRIAIGLGYGAQHSMDPIALFSLFPGWRVFVPTTPFDYIGLFNAAMKLKSPTLIVEHHEFYSKTGPVPEGPPDHVVAPGRAKVVKSGGQVTVASYGWMTALALQAAQALESEGVAAEVVDLRTLNDNELDYAALGNSLRKTGALVTVEQAPACNAIGPKIAAECQKRFFDWLDGPIASVNGPNVPLPVSQRLERACLPGVEHIADVVRRAARRQT